MRKLVSLPRKVRCIIPDGDRDKYYFNANEFINRVVDCLDKVLIKNCVEFSTLEDLPKITLELNYTHYDVHHEGYNLTSISFTSDFADGKIEVKHYGLTQDLASGQIETITIYFKWKKEKVTFS